jgi:hypothetical protein
LRLAGVQKELKPQRREDRKGFYYLIFSKSPLKIKKCCSADTKNKALQAIGFCPKGMVVFPGQRSLDQEKEISPLRTLRLGGKE